MSETVNDIVNGLACACCGVYFEREHGYPVVCRSCYDEKAPRNTQAQRAIHGEL